MSKSKSRTSRKRVEMVPEVPDHRHCPICGKVIPPNLEYCSVKCESIALKRRREEEFARKLFWIVAGVLFLTFLLGLLIRR